VSSSSSNPSVPARPVAEHDEKTAASCTSGGTHLFSSSGARGVRRARPSTWSVVPGRRERTTHDPRPGAGVRVGLEGDKAFDFR
jgi:hypothetical protein